MAESASNTRRTFLGGTAAATIPAGLAAGGLTATGNDLSTWAGGVANGPTRVMINRLGAVGSNPEEAEVSGIAGNVLTFSARGLRGTADQAHPANVSIEIVGSPRDFDEANNAVLNTLGRVTAAEQLLVSNAATTMAALAVAASRIVGRKATGSVAALTAAEIFAILGSGTPDATTFLRGDGSWQVPSAAAYGVRAKTTADQTVTAGAFLPILFGGEDFDDDGFHSTSSNTSRLTVPTGRGGLYVVDYTVDWTNGGTTSAVSFYLFVNGASIVIGNFNLRNNEIFASNSQVKGGSAILRLAAADYVELQATCTTANITINGASSQTQLAMARIGA